MENYELIQFCSPRIFQIGISVFTEGVCDNDQLFLIFYTIKALMALHQLLMIIRVNWTNWKKDRYHYYKSLYLPVWGWAAGALAFS